MAFKPHLLGHKPRGQRGESLVARYRAANGLSFPMAEVEQEGKLGGLPVAGMQTGGIGIPFSPPPLRGDGTIGGTTGPSSAVKVVPPGSYDYRKRIATIRASHAARAAAGGGLALAEMRKPSPEAKPTATPERPVLMGSAQVPGEIVSPFTMTSRSVQIDSRLLQPPPTAGYKPVRFF